jgi:death-on-curing protein
MAADRGSHRNQPRRGHDDRREAFRTRSRLLESALARPRNAFAYGEEDIVALAVRLLAGVAQAHAFEQGNKRTAFIAMTEFLILNGYDLAVDDATHWAEEVVSLVEHRASETDFVRSIRPFVVAR